MMKYVKSFAASAALAATLFVVAPITASAEEYTIDLSHSFIQFRTKHLGYSWLVGRFNKFEGTMNYDPSKGPEAQSIELTIDTSSIDSNWVDRDKHLRSGDFMNTDKFPTATFKSTKFEGDESGGMLSGDLTLLGVTKPISFEIKKIGEGKDPWGGYRAGFEGTYSLTRKDFGMGYNLGPAAEKVDLELMIEAIKKK
ncbi:MAG: YceI family protein [Hyphomicrobiales bacterium]